MARKWKAVYLPNIYKSNGEHSTQYDYSKYGGELQYSSNFDQGKNISLMDKLIKDEERLSLERKVVKSKQCELNEKWRKKQYVGYGIFVKYGGHIYEGIFDNNYMNGYGLYITPGGTIKKGIYNNFIPKGEGDIYTKIEGRLAFLLDRKTIDKNCFIGEENLKSEKE